MDNETPPKRVTRARAAAKPPTTTKGKGKVNTETADVEEVATTTVTAPKTARTKAAPTTTKRKTRADETEDVDQNDEEMDQPALRPKSRGRPKKSIKDIAAEAEQEMEVDELATVVVPKKTRTRAGTVEQEERPVVKITTKATRGRVASATVDETVFAPVPSTTTRGRQVNLGKEQELSAAAPKTTRGRPKKAAVEISMPTSEPVKATRGRAKKPEPSEEAELDAIEVVREPVKKTVRPRAAVAPAKAAVPKKVVKFEEPNHDDKENIVPVAKDNSKGKTPVLETGLKARAARRPAIAAARTTRGRGKPAEPEKSPLSPKKATQVAKSDQNTSEDELASIKITPMKPLMKSPMRAPGSVLGTAKRLDFSTSIVANRAAVPDTQNLGASLMGSPARRPPASPFKEALKSSPKRLAALGESILKSPFKMSAMGPPKPKDSPFKNSLLQSPARRPQSPTKVSVLGSPSRSNPSINTTPKALPFSLSRYGATPRTLTKDAYRPGQPSFGSPGKGTSSPGKFQQTPKMDAIKPFSGRLSSVMPRYADVDLRDAEIPASIPETDELALIAPEAQQPAFEPLIIADDAMVIDQGNFGVVDEIPNESTTPPQSPPRESYGSFRDIDVFADSESEDELASASPIRPSQPLFSNNISTRNFAPATPMPFVSLSKTPRTNKTIVADPRSAAASRSVRAQRDEVGFTPLATQLSSWMAGSPESSSSSTEDEAMAEAVVALSENAQEDVITIPEISHTESTFFEDEMIVLDETAIESEISYHSGQEIDNEEEIGFAPLILDDVDINLAAEADEMSLLEAEASDDEVDLLAAPEEQVENSEIPKPVTNDGTDLLVEDVMDIEEFIHTTPTPPAAPQVIMPVDILICDEENVAEASDILNASVGADTVSESSQEYGDENAIPIDPILLALDPKPVQATSNTVIAPAFATPIREEQEHVVHTVSKVPLKPEGMDTPSRPFFEFSKKRPASVSRVPSERQAPFVPVPATTVTSRTISFDPNVTPAKSNGWSTSATPSRTPKKDIDNSILKGAVVYVDVHTTEGADASAVFVELLGLMGARCVKSWSWNPNSSPMSPENSDGSSSERDSKIGITHVVFKDGGKRTIEKVRESKGVVYCVGVGWVLDCERNQTWLDEAPYSIDTSLVPRGGQRRRKSMEPRQLMAQNSTPRPTNPRNFSTPRTLPASKMGRDSSGNTPAREGLLVPATIGGHVRMDRRKSTIWERSPSSDGGDSSEDHLGMLLSPVPVTPRPEAISAYAEHVLDNEADGMATPYFLKEGELIVRTEPVERVLGRKEGGGVLGERRHAGDENGSGNGVLMQRLLLARRKSLQFAPKVGSPLARGRSFQE